MLTWVKTADGSNTLFNSEIGEHYHSRHGALQESHHVFLNSGLKYYLAQSQATDIKILEVGFGTGLNFLLSAHFCTENNIRLDYTGIEAYPLTHKMITETGYGDYIPDEIWMNFILKYQEALTQEVSINHGCNLFIAKDKLLDFSTQIRYDILYFDAFAAIHQPEMWEQETLSHAAALLKPGGLFVTYAITGNLKRTMKSLNFSVEKAPGAEGKREMLRAVKFLTRY
ncbi:MAG TPA: tRNA (5-methylaminomethyl-2-thiouridine)(34)-methyltransferase MnmD [Sphingobacteriaceae bacterium]|nr:tRNA (5-methylaminomethyl-2-thiouridine)(34)-methyltransferase MnmD [Sphingobacteriaceae bacterium]